jgi:ribosomal 50S subunit-recycling heat shock protein
VHRSSDGQIVRTPAAVATGDDLRIRVAGGEFAAAVTDVSATDGSATEGSATEGSATDHHPAQHDRRDDDGQ